MSHRQIAGVILLIICIAVPAVIYVGYKIYWLIIHYTNGDRWEDDAELLIGMVWVILMFVALALIIL